MKRPGLLLIGAAAISACGFDLSALEGVEGADASLDAPPPDAARGDAWRVDDGGASDGSPDIPDATADAAAGTDAGCPSPTFVEGPRSADGVVCDVELAAVVDGSGTGLARTGIELVEVDGVTVAACLQARFGEPVDRVWIRARHVSEACGAGPSESAGIGANVFADGRYLTDIALGDAFETHEIEVPGGADGIYVCRGNGATARAHVEVDWIGKLGCE